MKISRQRLLFETINFLLSVLFIFPLGVFLEQVFHYPLFSYSFLSLTAVLAYLAGRYSLPKTANFSILLCVVSTVIALIITAVFLPWLSLFAVLMMVLVLFFSVFFFFSARNAKYSIYAPFSIVGVIIHILILIVATGLQWSSRAVNTISFDAIVFFLLTLYAFSAKGLRKSLYRDKKSGGIKYPAGMQMGNFLLVTGFILVAAFISNIYPIFNLFSKLFVLVLKGIIAGFAFFSSLFDRRSVGTDVDEGVTEEVAKESILNAEPKGEAGWVTMSVEIFAFILVFLFVLYGLFKLYQKVSKMGLRLPGFIRNMKDRFAPVEDSDYVDETESLFDLKRMLSDTGARIGDAFKKLRDRPQKIDDFPDNRTKIRFVFQSMMKKVSRRNSKVSTLTPNELYAKEYSGEPDFNEFIQYYNSARYSDNEIPDSAVDCARFILKQKM